MARWIAIACLLGACQSGAAAGTTCRRTADCGPNLTCALGACRAACRESRDCGPDQRCLIEPSTGVSVCSVASIDDCTTHGCPADLVCAASQCVNACGTVVACPDGVCTGEVCTRAVGDAGPVMPDTGASDAGLSCHGPQCDPVVHLAMRYERAFAITQTGALWAWGEASAGSLGDGTTVHAGCSDCSARPVHVLAADGSPLVGVRDVSVGFDFGCALLADRSVSCWGRNYAGQRGDGRADDGSLIATHVVTSDGSGGSVALDRVVAIASGYGSTCAIREASATDAGAVDTEVWCWGNGMHGQLGTGTTPDFSGIALHATALGAHTIALSIAEAHVLALQSDRTTLGIGQNECGELADAALSDATLVAVPGPVDRIEEIAASTYDSCALGPGGLSCWGAQGAALGPSPGTSMACAGCAAGTCLVTAASITPPVPIEHLFGPSGGTFLGTTLEGALYAWGGAFDEPIQNQPTPMLVTGLPPVSEAHVGGAAACAVTLEGDVLCWGGNHLGQLGRGALSAMGAVDPVPASVTW